MNVVMVSVEMLRCTREVTGAWRSVYTTRTFLTQRTHLTASTHSPFQPWLAIGTPVSHLCYQECAHLKRVNCTRTCTHLAASAHSYFHHWLYRYTRVKGVHVRGVWIMWCALHSGFPHPVHTPCSKHTLQFPAPFPHSFPAHFHTGWPRTERTRRILAGVVETRPPEVDGKRTRWTVPQLPDTSWWPGTSWDRTPSWNDSRSLQIKSLA